MEQSTRHTAKFAPIDYWDRTDKTKRGFIPVEFKDEIVWARPIFQIGAFKVPTKEFVEENIDKVAVIVEPLDEDEGKLAWSGFTYWKNATPEATQEEYPYQKVLYSDEKWEVFSNTKEDISKFHLKHTDGTLIELSREKDKEYLEFVDGIFEHKIRMDGENVIVKDGVNDVTIETSEEGIKITDNVNDSKLFLSPEGIELVDGQNSTKLKSSEILLGTEKGEKEPVILGDKLVQMLNTVLQALAQHTHPTSVGPSGPPTNAATYTKEKAKTKQLKSRVSSTE